MARGRIDVRNRRTEDPMTLRSRSVRLVVALLAFTVATSACGDDDGANGGTADDIDGTEVTRPAAGPRDGQADPPDDAAVGASIEVADSNLGQILTSGGMTLYLFTPDDGGESACYGECATSWPPLIDDGDLALDENLDGALFDTIGREDGGDQVTVDDRPLYLFTGDSVPGEMSGRGIGGTWYPVAPDGSPVGQD
jgi:predicted lipoprotein with Yx(FWY)xxD motif